MIPESYLSSIVSYGTQPPLESDHPADSSLEQLIHQKSGILNRKLEILAAEIWWRLHLTSRNLASLEDDTARLTDMLSRLDVAANYHLREHQDKGVLYYDRVQAQKNKSHRPYRIFLRTRYD